MSLQVKFCRAVLKKVKKSKKCLILQLFAYILRIHGYPKFDAKFVAKDLEKAQQSWAEIRLFKDLSEIEP